MSRSEDHGTLDKEASGIEKNSQIILKVKEPKNTFHVIFFRARLEIT